MATPGFPAFGAVRDRGSRFSLAAILFLLPMQALALVRHVPADFPTIQGALRAASYGDVVLVAPGTFYESLQMPDGVTLESEAGYASTTIDGTGGPSVIYCSGVSRSTVIRGFHITGGMGTPQFNGTYGGGILCLNGASPLLEENRFTQNTAKYGGAIMCRYDSTPTIRNNVVQNNTADSEGGGILLIDALNETTLIEGNEIRGNTAGESGGGVWIGGANATFRGNTLIGNTAVTSAGAVWLGFAGDKELTLNVIAFNSCIGLGGAAWVDQGNTTVTQNTFYGNAAPDGGAIATGGSGSKYIGNNILAGSTQGAGLYCTAMGATEVMCNDFWGNAGGDQIPACVDDTGHNLNADPIFCDVEHEDFTLRSDSPCLDHNLEGCGLVGALGEGCGATPVRLTTWGSIKARYRW